MVIQKNQSKYVRFGRQPCAYRWHSIRIPGSKKHAVIRKCGIIWMSWCISGKYNEIWNTRCTECNVEINNVYTIWYTMHHIFVGNYGTGFISSNIAFVKGTVYPKKYAHGFVVLCFVVVMQSFIMTSHEVIIHIHQGCFAGTGAIVRLPQCQWSKPDGYGKISQCITTTKHSKAKTVCIFLGIYCTWWKTKQTFGGVSCQKGTICHA